MRRHLIIGAGNAGLSAARTLARLSPDDSIEVISSEPWPAYCRCLLTYFLEGEVDKQRLFGWGEKIIQENRLNFHAAKTVLNIDLQKKTVDFAAGKSMSADTILIATGGEPKKPVFPGADLPGIFTLRNFNDALAMQKFMRPGGRWAIVGAGLVGLKSLAALRQKNISVELFAASERILSQVLDKTASELAAAQLTANQVKINLLEEITEVTQTGKQRLCLTTSKGRELVVDGLLYGKGVDASSPVAVDNWGAETGFPPVSLTKAGAGADGLEVNRNLAICEDIYAAGDVARAYDLILQKANRISLWPTAGEQGIIAGYNMAGHQRTYNGGINCNSFSLFGLDFISAGFKEIPQDNDEWQQEKTFAEGNYCCLNFYRKKLKGFILAGPEIILKAGPLLAEIKRNSL